MWKNNSGSKLKKMSKRKIISNLSRHMQMQQEERNNSPEKTKKSKKKRVRFSRKTHFSSTRDESPPSFSLPGRRQTRSSSSSLKRKSYSEDFNDDSDSFESDSESSPELVTHHLPRQHARKSRKFSTKEDNAVESTGPGTGTGNSTALVHGIRGDGMDGRSSSLMSTSLSSSSSSSSSINKGQVKTAAKAAKTAAKTAVAAAKTATSAAKTAKNAAAVAVTQSSSNAVSSSHNASMVSGLSSSSNRSRRKQDFQVGGTNSNLATGGGVATVMKFPMWCLRCKKHTDSKNVGFTTTVNNRSRATGTCSGCTAQKSLFVPNFF